MSCCVCLFGPGGSDGFSNSPSSASGDESIPRSRRCYFGIFFPEDVGVRPAHMFFDREKPAAKILEGAAAYAGMKLDKGRLMGSPEKLNVFTLEGDVLRLDLELEAHLGGALHPSSILILEKGNRLSDERIAAVKAMAVESASTSGCSIM
mmetsp:Transcript_56660/g.123317  ORF Transcript_56660/g.123317 Transcript_56660/m.123317 type:complete len:150 (+) Transcript_56660:225-674(+)